ncbi:MAG: cation:proton antiporter [Butyricicoccaceae bacterium]
MLTALALVFLAGLLLGEAARRMGLPRIVGMLAAGILLGPCGLDLLDAGLLTLSPDLRRMALVIILLKAGLALDPRDLRAVGRPALCMAFLPALCELLAYTALAPLFFGVTHTEAALMGSVLAAVSPAVVVPRMIALMEEGRGTARGIPQMILAGASLDDVFVLVLFSTFTGLAAGTGASAAALLSVPVSIVCGVAAGLLTGLGLLWFFRTAGRTAGVPVRAILLLSFAFLLLALETLLAHRLPLSGMLAVIAMACVLRRLPGAGGQALAGSLSALWTGAEVLLFVLVGAAVDLRYTLYAGPRALVLLVLALAVRAVGVLLSTAGAGLTRQERLFCVAAYLPKATVQAAVGAVPLAMGLPCGSLVLSAAVLGILVTAPLGALSIDRLAPRCLARTDPKTPLPDCSPAPSALSSKENPS